MVLELSEQQARDLTEVLSQSLGEMHDEVMHTDNREYRAALRARRERLEAVLRKLQTAEAGSQAYA